MIDHITYQVTAEALHHDELTLFMDMLNFEEIDAAEEIKEGWDVRWWVHREYVPSGRGRAVYLRKPEIHMVAQTESAPHPLGLSHFCVTGVGKLIYEACRGSEWCEHAREGSGRIWLAGPGGIRVEVRP